MFDPVKSVRCSDLSYFFAVRRKHPPATAIDSRSRLLEIGLHKPTLLNGATDE